MKLSEMTTEQLERALCELAEPIGRIGQNRQIGDKFREVAGSVNGRSKIEVFSEIFASVVPVLLREHAADLHKILSVMTGKSVQEIAQQNGLLTIREARACIDGDLIDFFR